MQGFEGNTGRKARYERVNCEKASGSATLDNPGKAYQRQSDDLPIEQASLTLLATRFSVEGAWKGTINSSLFAAAVRSVLHIHPR